MDETQRFTGAYNPQGTLGDKPVRAPNRQDTTIVLPASGQKCTFKPGDIIDQSYELLRLLGRGGMGIVFACRHTTMDKEYALKLLSDEQLTPESWSRFQAEAKALARLNHPGIIGIHNMGIHAGAYPYYVMDLLRGETLDLQIARKGRLPVKETLDIFMQVTVALHSAHQQGIIHRDIKPSNLMIERDSRGPQVKVMDFGIARLTQHEISKQSQTATGLIFGTPYYMSPEQCQGLKADERSDIYSLGCTFFEALTGLPPFCGENSFRTFMMHQTKRPPTLAEIAPDGNFTDALELVVATMLKKDPAGRYQTMMQVQHDLERIKYNKPVREQGLVSIASSTTETTAKRFDIQSDTARLVKIATGFTAAIFSVWALFAFVIKPQDTRARVEAELSKSKAAADSMASLDKIARTPASAFAKTKDPAAIVAERNRYNQDPRGVYTSYVTPEDFMDHGISASEFDQTTNFSYRLLGEEKKVFNEHLRHHLAQCKKNHTMFKRTKPQPGFQFFDNISIGAIQINGKKPVFATNFVPVPKNSDVCLYLETATSDSPILDFFGRDDINGVEFVWPVYKPLLQHCLNWNHLKKLCTFNSLIKAPLLAEQLDETAIDDNDLLTIDQCSGLTTLGLSGRKITPEAILKMRTLSNVEALRFKTVANIDKIIAGLAPLNNLKELWLLNEGLTDEQLKPLINIKNLQTLRIMRSPLTPDSYKIFALLPNLKTLNLSTSWDSDEQEKFKANLPRLHVTFEPSTDLSYWVLVTKGPKTTPHYNMLDTK